MPFERYMDDAIVHCRRKEEAEAVKEALNRRFTECKLEMHPEKTKRLCSYTGASLNAFKLDNKSRMNREVHVRFWERLRGKLPWSTRLKLIEEKMNVCHK
ncbi:MAG: hypothetical protein JW795_05505 [Chitinivibrionales bacterium]|nr:hypothetical protein [Chitinivibrionales bacterium]